MACRYLEHLHVDVDTDQRREPIRKYGGAYCEHPDAAQVDQPMQPEDVEKCNAHTTGVCWRGYEVT